MIKFLLLWLLLTCIGPAWVIATGQVDFKADYRTANRESAKLAPDAATTEEAVIQAYAARAFNWRGMIATHCWIATKPKGADSYTVYQVVGWRKYHGLPALSIEQDIPDRHWYNAAPQIFLDMRGEQAENLIPRIDMAGRAYPDAEGYTLWPGPNSNSFPAYIGRQVPELGLVMPASAVGKDYLPQGVYWDTAPSGTGYQFSAFGALGFTLAKKEGLEVNILGLTYGIRFWPFGVLLPGF